MGMIHRVSSKCLSLFLENWQRGWILLLWVMVMAALFTWKFIQYRNRAAFQVMGYCLATAKGAAETLKLNMALILLPVCRNTLTYLRSTIARSSVPFDDNINFHKVGSIAVNTRLTSHISNAFCILGLTFFYILTLTDDSRCNSHWSPKPCRYSFSMWLSPISELISRKNCLHISWLPQQKAHIHRPCDWCRRCDWDFYGHFIGHSVHPGST